MFKKSIFFLFLIASITVSSQERKQNNELTKVTFKIKNFGIHVDGDFSEIKIETNFNSKKLQESYLNASIAVLSISTGIESRDEHLLKEDYFDESNHKNIILRSTKIIENSEGSLKMFADLTMKGITRKIEASIEVFEKDSTIIIKSNFNINRRDFKIGGGSFILSKTVKIQVEYSSIK
tara:strand:+ start:2805 stop:3341 length:537 start_codon:yes stop_codon:yes gene_type:complete